MPAIELRDLEIVTVSGHAFSSECVKVMKVPGGIIVYRDLYGSDNKMVSTATFVPISAE